MNLTVRWDAEFHMWVVRHGHQICSGHSTWRQSYNHARGIVERRRR